MLTWPTFSPIPFLKGLLKAGIFIWPLWLIPLIHYDEPFSLITRSFDQETATYIRLWAAPSFTLLSIVLNVGKVMRPSTVVMCALVNLYLSGLALYNAWGALFPPHYFKSLMSAYRFLTSLDLYHYLLYLAWLTPPVISFTAFSYLYRIRSEWSLKIRERLHKGFRVSSPFETSDTHGSARLASLKEIKALNNRQGIPIGVTVSSYDAANPRELADTLKNTKGRDIVRIKSEHALVVAPSGAGKGVGIVIPTLLDYQGPVLVTDIKGENFTITARHRREQGRRVFAFDPFEITKGPRIRINILDLLEEDSPSLVDTAASLAHILCPTDQAEYGGTRYFTSQAAAVLQCLMIYVKCSPKIAEDARHLGTVYRLLCQRHEEMKALLEELHTHEHRGGKALSHLAGRLLATAPEELSGILNTAALEVRFTESPYVQSAIQCSDVSLSDLTKGDMDLYLCIPPEHLEAQSRLLKLIVGGAFLEIQKARGRIGHTILMVLDELPSLGYIPQVDAALAFGRGYGISILGISQTLPLLKAVYRKSWETFLSSNLSVFFGASDPMTKDYVSNALGRTTVRTTSYSHGHGNQRRGGEFLGSSSHQEGSSYSEAARPLLTVDEIHHLGDRIVLAFMRGEHPLMMQRLNYLERPEWRGAFDANPLHRGPVLG